MIVCANRCPDRMSEGDRNQAPANHHQEANIIRRHMCVFEVRETNEWKAESMEERESERLSAGYRLG